MSINKKDLIKNLSFYFLNDKLKIVLILYLVEMRINKEMKSIFRHELIDFNQKIYN